MLYVNCTLISKKNHKLCLTSKKLFKLVENKVRQCASAILTKLFKYTKLNKN